METRPTPLKQLVRMTARAAGAIIGMISATDLFTAAEERGWEGG